jgi:hypothetical protein
VIRRWLSRNHPTLTELEAENARLRQQLALAGLLVWYYRAAAAGRQRTQPLRRHRWRDFRQVQGFPPDRPTEVFRP